NTIRSAKYTILNFLPINLFIQFSNVVNIYFLVISIIQFIPNVSTVGQISTLLPLSIFVSLAIIHEGYDDFKRHTMDRQENDREVLRINLPTQITKVSTDKIPLSPGPTATQTVPCSSLRVGDIVRVDQDDWIPADLVLLGSEHQDGTCYVETASLDGETNLKKLQTLKELQDMYLSDASFQNLRGYIRVEEPTLDLYSIQGYYQLSSTGSFQDGNQLPLSINQVLLRGTLLRNTSYVYGIVIYSGEQTKVRLNATKHVQTKIPFLTKTMNHLSFIAFSLVIILAITASVINLAFRNDYVDKVPYLLHGRISENAFINFLSFIIILNTIVPISLFVTLEFCKIVQAFFISQDLKMYNNEKDTPASFHTTQLNEDLGMVSYIFSDKTGTLTENAMYFRRMTVNDVSYQLEEETRLSRTASRKSIDFSQAIPQATALSLSPGTPLYSAEQSEFDNAFSFNPSDPYTLALTLAICHTVDPENTGTLPPKYRATSPDEFALVTAGHQFGFTFMKRTTANMTIYNHASDKEVTLPILNCLEFTSARKKMSIIIQFPDGKIRLLVKGADSIMIPRLHKNHASDQITKLESSLYKYSCEGLRTLVFASKELTKNEYEEWKTKYDKASQQVGDDPEEIDLLCSELETNLTLLGCTGLEDQLQEGVPESISLLRRAGIKIWVLTGDKLETAINIGQACSLIEPRSDLIILDHRTDDLGAQIKTGLDKLKAASVPDVNTLSDFVLIIDGQTFGVLDNGPSVLQESFLDLALQCGSVILCRSSPSQKAQVVKMVRKRTPSSVTLAIGDGGNDVAMIQQAHVGIGISGNEGVMAAKSSDYSIAQFSYLVPLLLVHGRWNYHRNTRFTLLTFYKCMVFYMTLYFYQTMTGFSGTSWFENWSYIVYNSIFTLLPVIAIGTLDQDKSRKMLLDNPEDYSKVGPRHKYLNWKTYIFHICMALVHAAFIVLPYLVFMKDNVWVYGGGLQPTAPHIIFMGQSVYLTAVLVANLKVAYLASQHTTFIHIGFFLISIIVFFCFQFVISAFTIPNHGYYLHNYIYQLLGSSTFWLCFIWSVGSIVFLDYLIKAINMFFF
ncbi:phospholipid-translocating P-type ATPase, partial [Conidiobolus coronatus NRRL 28638]